MGKDKNMGKSWRCCSYLVIGISYLFFSACKTYQKPDPEIKSEETHAEVSIKSKDIEKNTNVLPVVTIGLIDEDEKFILVDQSIIDEYTADISVPIGKEKQDVFIAAGGLDSIEEATVETLLLSKEESNKLELTGFRTIEMTKKVVRIFESARDATLRMIQGRYWKENYFKNAVNSEWNNPRYGKANAMPFLQTNVVKFLDLSSYRAQNIVLGMAPNKEVLKKAQAEFQKTLKPGQKSSRDMTIVSAVENFELDYIKDNTSGLRSRPIEVQLSRNSQKKNNTSDVIIRVSNWKQVATPDRTMLSEDSLKEGIEYVLEGMKKNPPALTYVHCKSGKGRSATIVAASRVAAIMNASFEQGIELTQSHVDQLIKEQVKAMKAVRPEVSINFGQIANMKAVLYKMLEEKAPPSVNYL